MVVTERLYRDHPDLPEGQLAKLRASVVNMHALAGVAATLGGPDGLGAHLYLGRGEELTGGRTKTSILADATEALIGAVYLRARPGDRPLGRAPAVRLAAARPRCSAPAWTGRPACRS